MKCDHKGFWKSAGQFTLKLPDKLLLFVTMFCENCGKIEVSEKDLGVEIPKGASGQQVVVPIMTGAKPPGGKALS